MIVTDFNIAILGMSYKFNNIWCFFYFGIINRKI